MRTEALVAFEIVGLLALRGVVLDDVEVQDLLTIVEALQARDVVVVRVGGDEPADRLVLTLSVDLLEDFLLAIIWQTTIDDREVVCAVSDVEHVAVADS